MLTEKIPPPRLARIVERARHRVSLMHQRSVPPYAAMMELVVNAWTAQAITAATQLGVADALSDGPLPLQELASRVDANPEALRRLLRALIGRGIFRQRRDGRYDLNPLGATLRSDAPLSTGGFAMLLGSVQHREHWSHLVEAIRTGRGVVPESSDGAVGFDFLNDNPELAAVFNRAMAETSALTVAPLLAAYSFDDYRTIVDVGGGVGQLLATILQATPTARGVLHDLPHAVADAPALMAKNQIAERVTVTEGSFFDGVPEDGDIYVLKNIIHDWPDDKALEIIQNVRKAAKVGAAILLMEFVIPEHKRDYMGHWTDLEMLLWQAGRERTEPEIRSMLEAAGFRVTRMVPTASPLSLIEARAI